jgi:hypothetical protein
MKDSFYTTTGIRMSIIAVCMVLFVSCNKVVMKLAVPQAFKEQATAVHVEGSRSRHISFANYSTSKIKRGVHVKYPGWGRGFFLENIVLNHFGLSKEEHVEKEKDRFRYSISDGKNAMQVFGKEQKITRSLEYKLLGGKGLFSSYERLQQFSYIFSALITTDTAKGAAAWELVMTNFYDRKKDTVNSLFTIIRPDDNGVATNGKDSVFIRPVSLQKAERPDGREGKLLFKVLAGYELSTPDGVVAIIDLVHKDLWFYNELEATDKLTIAAIATALYARRVNDVQW